MLNQILWQYSKKGAKWTSSVFSVYCIILFDHIITNEAKAGLGVNCISAGRQYKCRKVYKFNEENESLSSKLFIYGLKVCYTKRINVNILFGLPRDDQMNRNIHKQSTNDLFRIWTFFERLAETETDAFNYYFPGRDFGVGFELRIGDWTCVW